MPTQPPNYTRRRVLAGAASVGAIAAVAGAGRLAYVVATRPEAYLILQDGLHIEAGPSGAYASKSAVTTAKDLGAVLPDSVLTGSRGEYRVFVRRNNWAGGGPLPPTRAWTVWDGVATPIFVPPAAGDGSVVRHVVTVVPSFVENVGTCVGLQIPGSQFRPDRVAVGVRFVNGRVQFIRNNGEVWHEQINEVGPREVVIRLTGGKAFVEVRSGVTPAQVESGFKQRDTRTVDDPGAPSFELTGIEGPLALATAVDVGPNVMIAEVGSTFSDMQTLGPLRLNTHDDAVQNVIYPTEVGGAPELVYGPIGQTL